MSSTRVGYAGGTKDSPTYHSLGDHTEVVQIHYDPNQVEFKKLLEAFFASHEPVSRSYSRQYMSLILYNSEEQKVISLKAIDELVKRRGRVDTEVAPHTRFFLAESYHQKYYLRRVSVLINELLDRYNTLELEEFVSSPIVSRINGYVGGYGTLAGLKKDLEGFALSEKAQAKLLNIVATR